MLESASYNFYYKKNHTGLLMYLQIVYIWYHVVKFEFQLWVYTEQSIL